eukprot:scaffold6228_cov79-Cyclotella_meneghiniana.AAC.3
MKDMFPMQSITACLLIAISPGFFVYSHAFTFNYQSTRSNIQHTSQQYDVVHISGISKNRHTSLRLDLFNEGGNGLNENEEPKRASTSQSVKSSETMFQHDDNDVSYPLQIHHQGLTATIQVKENEPILQALERQSSSSNNKSTNTSLGLSSIPHDCRRGNCLTCASRLMEGSIHHNIQPNVNNGLAPPIAKDLTRNGYILTCCSYINGPGVTLELEQNEELWDRVYRSRFDNMHQLGREIRARQKRKLDEANVGKWRKRMEKLFDT